MVKKVPFLTKRHFFYAIFAKKWIFPVYRAYGHGCVGLANHEWLKNGKYENQITDISVLSKVISVLFERHNFGWQSQCKPSAESLLFAEVPPDFAVWCNHAAKVVGFCELHNRLFVAFCIPNVWHSHSFHLFSILLTPKTNNFAKLFLSLHASNQLAEKYGRFSIVSSHSGCGFHRDTGSAHGLDDAQASYVGRAIHKFLLEDPADDGWGDSGWNQCC